MTEKVNCTEKQFEQQLHLIIKAVRLVQLELIETPVESFSWKVGNDIIQIDGRPISIEGNTQITEIENGSLVSILSNGFWDTVVIKIENGEIHTEEAGKGGAPILIYPDSVVYYEENGVINCSYVLAMNREITLFPTVKYTKSDKMIEIQELAIAVFIKKLEDKLKEAVDKIKVLKGMIETNVDKLIEKEFTDIILTFEDAITLLPNRNFENKLLTPEYVVEFFLRGIESVQYYQRSI
ncbi:hypothetical protein EIN_327770 [Entamoeba invadens IP1]|uniref:Uncharacterized protein n=1 Tax=Entamoeba invadens IP1 TaxID=370355 RepID=A0A0A1TXN3_ENTIV|nr:hypothetical protein EIN_327770 [Entamoeba invadens IP1]ELP86120.1 hypothetical protein EIN_327770 [Entamoeba invadens IP1]|eukprot:XP_004185466.1 hypothetical protein EIN_327770 [Entamoeba invadens IP1]